MSESFKISQKRLQKTPIHKHWLILDLFAVIMGLIGGTTAILLVNLIDLMRKLFLEVLLPRISITIGAFNLGYIILPVLGSLIVGILTSKFSPESKGSGIPVVLESMALKGGKMKFKVAVWKMIVTSITIGSGGSSGREGPIATIGALNFEIIDESTFPSSFRISIYFRP